MSTICPAAGSVKMLDLYAAGRDVVINFYASHDQDSLLATATLSKEEYENLIHCLIVNRPDSMLRVPKGAPPLANIGQTVRYVDPGQRVRYGDRFTVAEIIVITITGNPGYIFKEHPGETYVAHAFEVILDGGRDAKP